MLPASFTGCRRRLVRRADRTVTGLQTGPYWVTAHPARQHLDVCCPTGSTDQTQDTKSVVGGVRTDQAAARSCSQSSERGIAWRVADSLSLRSFLRPGCDRGVAGPLDAVTYASVHRRGDSRGGVRVGSGTSVGGGSVTGKPGRGRCDDSGSERIDAEHRAAGHRALLRGVHSAVGGTVWCGDIDAGELARCNRSRRNKKTSNKDWKSPQDPDTKIGKIKDGWSAAR